MGVRQNKVKETTHLETIYKGLCEYKKSSEKPSEEPSKKLLVLIRRIEKQTGINYYELPEYEGFQYLCIELLKISKISDSSKKALIKKKIERYLEDKEEFLTYMKKNIRSHF